MTLLQRHLKRKREKAGTSAEVPGQLCQGRGLVQALQMEERRQPVRLAPVFQRPGQKKGGHK